VRFGKRKNTLAALGRRLFGKQQESSSSGQSDEGIAREERDALLDGTPYQGSSSTYSQDMEPLSGFGSLSMDPIQQLWAKLGHFSRLLSRAQGSANATDWDDQAMADLAEALEIALNNDMQTICTPLIDVGRVLASYRAVGKPAQCLPFLFEAYDQLSMIAGDMAVGSVSEAVQRRWEELYDAQARHMRAEGIPLLEDDENDEDEERPETVADAPASVDSPSIPEQGPMDAPASPPGNGDSPERDTTGGAIPETGADRAFFEDVDDALKNMEEAGEETETSLPPPPPDESILSTSGWQSVMTEITQPASVGNLPQPTESVVPPAFPPQVDEPDTTINPDAGVSAYPEETTMEADTSAQVVPDHAIPSEHVPPEETADDTPSKATDLADMEQKETSDNLITFPLPTEERVSSAPDMTTDIPDTGPDAMEPSATTPHDVDAIVDAATPETGHPEPRNEDTLPPDSDEAVPNEDVSPDTADTPANANEPLDTSPQPSADPHPVVHEPAPDPVEAINRAMQEAMRAGNVAEARVLAIRLAAALARQEVEHAEQTIAATMLELENNLNRLDEASQREREAEERVARVEAQIAERQEDQATNRQHLMEIDSDIQARKARVEDLEAQIRCLQELRANELDRLRDKELERESILARDSLLDAELSALDAEEEAARDFLNDARDRITHLRNERESLEARLVEWQQERDRRARHVEEIEAPLNPKDPPSDPSAPDQQPLLC